MYTINDVLKENYLAKIVWIALVLFPNIALAEQSLPDINSLEHGDLIWPKTPGQFIPYSSEPLGDYSSDAENWNRQKANYISAVGDSKSSSYEKLAAEWLEELSYEEFRDSYIGQAQDEILGTLGLPAPYVGHVGIISIENGVPWVVEAVLGKGVQKIRYQDWLEERSNADVWLGRFKKISLANKRKIVDLAKSQLEKPYSLFNRNLINDKSFYCSKLVWYSVFKSLGFALDNNTDPKRIGWLSPKQLMWLPYIKLIFEPSAYYKPELDAMNVKHGS